MSDKAVKIVENVFGPLDILGAVLYLWAHTDNNQSYQLPTITFSDIRRRLADMYAAQILRNYGSSIPITAPTLGSHNHPYPVYYLLTGGELVMWQQTLRSQNMTLTVTTIQQWYRYFLIPPLVRKPLWLWRQSPSVDATGNRSPQLCKWAPAAQYSVRVILRH